MRRKYGLYAILFSIIISGCSCKDPIYEQVEVPKLVEVPTYTPCPLLKNADLEPLELPVYSLNKDSSYKETGISYIESILLLENRNEDYIDIIKKCKNKKGLEAPFYDNSTE